MSNQSSQTPNHILQTEDIPDHLREHIPANVNYPPGCRYTLQWLETTDEAAMFLIPNNSDATFRKRVRKRDLPSDVLLHYIYGAAAVKNWGRGMEILQKHANPPRPQVPAPAPAGPSKTIQDRATTIKKCEAAKKRGRAGAGAGVLVESEDQVWDEDDTVLYFWGNTQAAKKRHLKKANKETRRIEQWRGGVSQGV